GVIASIAGVSDEEVEKVIEKFRQPGRSLLIPGSGIMLESNSVIEISHESLMRIWTRLRIWVDEEFEAAQMYLRLSEASAKYQIGKAGLWRNPDLQLALNWKHKYQPTLDWA
ncbi:MAG: High-affnity carbon uptake protein Hat/HatR, partial [Bacteroidota bacterium]|nr:High-affnity carbon uptake protein Hat/HatR [Bacteroidota bacterium]